MTGLLLVLLACEPSTVRQAPLDSEDTSVEADTDTDTDTDTDADADADADTDADTACATDMVRIPAAVPYCIDRYEAHLTDQSPYATPTSGTAANRAGAVPQGYISQTVAALACDNAGKRLCTASEWTRACRGSTESLYPYGDSYDATACNDTRDTHPVVELFGTPTWSTSEMSDPRLNQLADSLDPSGANADCVSEDGVYDMHGNLHEWIADPAGTFKGGFYVDAVLNGAGCTYTTTAHSVGYHDYSTGFRCCADTN
ncbi:MAG: SUMF1/EgtB/PvdO family nonheme iron enzyme [Proteobacteria bacterium]|nr:SUMF1/EgtB/PvdO family nonheme iron enzyme [Pseudomonadota bacterium]